MVHKYTSTLQNKELTNNYKLFFFLIKPNNHKLKKDEVVKISYNQKEKKNIRVKNVDNFMNYKCYFVKIA